MKDGRRNRRPSFWILWVRLGRGACGLAGATPGDVLAVDTFPGAHGGFNLVGVAAVAGFAGDVLEVVAEGGADEVAAFVRDNGKLEAGVLRLLEEDVQGRLLVLLHKLHLVEKELAEENDALVAFTELLELAVGDRALGVPAEVVLVEGEVEEGELAVLAEQRNVA